MKTLFGAVAGALTLGAVLVSYSLGEQHTFSRDAAMAAGYQQMANPYLVRRDGGALRSDQTALD